MFYLTCVTQITGLGDQVAVPVEVAVRIRGSGPISASHAIEGAIQKSTVGEETFEIMITH